MNDNKEAYFIECVKEAAKALGLKHPPKVKVWEGACPYSSGDEIAHAHPDLGLICISRSKLESMNLDEIRETAFHETTHMLHLGHDTDFSTSMDDAHLAAWLEARKPRTITHKSKRHAGKQNENKVDKERCNYHLCRKKTKLYRCEYCGRYFCEEHRRPGLAIPRSAIDSIKDRVLRDKIYEEWRKTDRHPDWPWTQRYFEELKLKEKEKNEKIWEALKKLNEPKKLPPPSEIPPPPPPEQPPSIRIPISIKSLAIITIAVLIFLGFLFVFTQMPFTKTENHSSELIPEIKIPEPTIKKSIFNVSIGKGYYSYGRYVLPFSVQNVGEEKVYISLSAVFLDENNIQHYAFSSILLTALFPGAKANGEIESYESSIKFEKVVISIDVVEPSETGMGLKIIKTENFEFPL